ncbi:hypothetical protein ANANG_G00066070 [Anguilla anguilla]|uniref:Uncharacterized protein n=1 Tax=Anguilla anguilla TaxID=7936 RepID=A0A9D3MRN0_ANGAN|nr:hypothetical protein ANANG_G00066070 [Anguilla anguilla]
MGRSGSQFLVPSHSLNYCCCGSHCCPGPVKKSLNARSCDACVGKYSATLKSESSRLAFPALLHCLRFSICVRAAGAGNLPSEHDCSSVGGVWVKVHGICFRPRPEAEQPWFAFKDASIL